MPNTRCVFNAFLLITLCIILSNTLIINVYLHFRHLQQRMRDGDSITEGDKWGMDGKKERKQKGDKGDNEAVTSHALPYALLSLAPRFSQLITSISFLGHNKSNLTNKKKNPPNPQAIQRVLLSATTPASVCSMLLHLIVALRVQGPSNKRRSNKLAQFIL